MKIEADFIFKALNFLLIAGIVVYVIRRFGISFIVDSMRTEKKERVLLQEHYETLVQEHQTIHDEIQEQDQTYKEMQKKFYVWEQVVKRKSDHQEQLLEKRKQIVGQKYSQKIQKLQQRRLIKKELPRVMQECVQDLEKTFKTDSAKRKLYISQLVSFLEK